MQLSMYTLVTADFSLAESIQMAARAGFDAVDIRQAEDGCHLSLEVSDADVQKVRTMVEDAGLHISGLTTYWKMGIPDPEAAQELRAGLRRGCETANLLGAGFLRCSACDLDREVGYENQRELFREQFAGANQTGAEYDVTITIEQHSGGMCASAGQILDLTRGLSTDHIGIVYDPGNCLAEGFERITSQIEMLRSLIRAVHLKNGTSKADKDSQNRFDFWCVPLDEGFLKWPEIISQLKDIGFDNYLTLEELSLHEKFSTVQEMLDWDVPYVRSLM